MLPPATASLPVQLHLEGGQSCPQPPFTRLFPEPERPPAQNVYFMLNCSIRGSLAARITPKLLLCRLFVGFEKFV